MRDVPYEQQTLDHPNPLARHAHRARLRLALDEAARVLPVGGVLLDYGAGQGRFLHLLRQRLQEQGREGERLIGFDPYMAPIFPGVDYARTPEEVEPGSVDCLTILEVCEHLDEAETAAWLACVRRVLRPGGTLLVTVPIVIGPAIVPKEIARMLLFRRASDIRFGEFLACVFLGRAPRRAESIRHSHRGYDWRVTRRLLEAEFGPVRVGYSPFPRLGPWMNSQVMLRVQVPGA